MPRSTELDDPIERRDGGAEPPDHRLAEVSLRDFIVARARLWWRWFGPGRVAAAIGGLVVAAALGWWLLRTPPPPTEARLPRATTTTVEVAASEPAAGVPTSIAAAVVTESPISSVPSTVVVHVAGAVAVPGVYSLPTGARVADAVAAAGGSTADGDPNALNLAATVADGDRVGVPRIGEDLAVAPQAAPADAEDAAPVGPIDVNRATVDELDQLPGIGPATASAIVAHREANGPFASVDDLEGVRGIGPAKLDTIRALVTV